MPSNEPTWALYGMAIVAAPTVAVWLWRRLGRRKRVAIRSADDWAGGQRELDALARSILPEDGCSVSIIAVRDRGATTCYAYDFAASQAWVCRHGTWWMSPISCDGALSLCGGDDIGWSRPTDSEKREWLAMWDNLPRGKPPDHIPDATKMVPYAQSAAALGSKPEAPWVTRQLEKLGVLCHENERRLDALEAKEPEAGRGGYRVWAVSGGWWLWDGSDVYYHEHGSGYWHTSPGWTVAKLPRDAFESSSNIRDLVVAEFLEWRGK